MFAPSIWYTKQNEQRTEAVDSQSYFFSLILLNHFIGSAPENLEQSTLLFTKGHQIDCSLAQNIFFSLDYLTTFLRSHSIENLRRL